MLKIFNLLNLNFLFSIIGIFSSYFIFGINLYLYPRFEISQIFLNIFFLSLLTLFILLIIRSFLNKIKILTFQKIFEMTLFLITFYFLFHFVIRFIDLNFYHIYSSLFKTENNFIKVLFYALPVLFGFIVFIFFKKKIYNIQKFIFIFLIILNLLSFFRIIEIYASNINQFNLDNDYKNLNIKQNLIENKKIDKKIFFIIFDEFDYAYFIKNIDKLPNLKSIYRSSYVNNNFKSLANSTLNSVPSILTGSTFKDKIISKGKLFIKNHKEEKIEFNFQNSFFNLNNEKNKLSTSIYGDVHPYCKVFKIVNCYDRYKFKKENLNFFKSLQIFIHVSYLDKILPVKNFFNYTLKTNFKLMPMIFSPEIVKVMYENTNKFINSDSDIIYIHYPYPHLSQSKQILEIINFENTNQILNKYEVNLLMVDVTIKKIFDNASKYNSSLIIITTDHGLRDKNLKIDQKERIVFFSKIIGDNEYIEDKTQNYSRNIKKLIVNYNNGMINSNSDINDFLNKNND